jgi:hypothetical protein
LHKADKDDSDKGEQTQDDDGCGDAVAEHGGKLSGCVAVVHDRGSRPDVPALSCAASKLPVGVHAPGDVLRPLWVILGAFGGAFYRRFGNGMLGG